MKKITLCIKVYGNEKKTVDTISATVAHELKELAVQINIAVSADRWAMAEIEGEDEEFASNLLIRQYGTVTSVPEEGVIYKGFIDSIEEDRIVVDIGTQIIIPPENMKDLGPGNARQIASRFGMIRYLPVEVEIINNAPKIQGKFSKYQADTWWQWKKAGYDRVTANAITRSELKAAVKRTGHARDIYGIERLGIMEHAIVCRETTDGPGIVAAIGRLVPSELGVIIGSF
ncbi:MAG: hypothetical protein A4E24_00925 [Methanomethylovorans sp. PtaU1.Bin093]|uniref:DUF2110 family protein n=1 Tax=Methanomethylovorans sp. PtaU1.Bin093 TaxID=1811679 RepID=UPI0009CCDC42|nr:DUF2110 family protein [Methanomethylovorans sp. PtaU1.Bin093]OPY20835.1 MAG: hypothetical protein A4E24_00925 [Methanomethylovorans sp. PtaU1.Bin093]